MSQQIVESVRARFPYSNPGGSPLGADHPAFLLAVCPALGPTYGLLKKSSGTHVVLPDGTSVSQDVVMLPDGQAWDVLQDGEGAATPVYNKIENVDASLYYQVTSGAAPGPTPPSGCMAAGFPSFDPDMRNAIGRIEGSLGRIETALSEARPSRA